MNKMKRFSLPFTAVFLLLSSTSAHATVGEAQWTATTRGVVWSSPALSPDGSQVAVGSYDRHLRVYAVASGKQLWNYDTGNYVFSSPSYSRDGQVIYLASSAGVLLALSAPKDGSQDGVLLWQYEMGGKTDYANPAVDSNGNIYIGSRDRYLHVVDASGALLWRYRAGTITSSISVDENAGTVYFAAGSYLYALSAPSGINSKAELKWRYKTEGRVVNSAPAIGADGSVIYVGSGKGYLHAINTADGSLRWEYQSSNGIYSSPVIDDSGVVYFGNNDGKLSGLSAQGELVFQYDAGGRIMSTPAIGSDRVLYVGSRDKHVHALPLPTYGATTELHQPEALWRYNTGGVVRSSPVIGEQVVIVGSFKRTLVAINSSSNGLLDSPWPKLRGNNQGWSSYDGWSAGDSTDDDDTTAAGSGSSGGANNPDDEPADSEDDTTNGDTTNKDTTNEDTTDEDTANVGTSKWFSGSYNVIPFSPTLSPDSSELAIAGYDRHLRVYDVASGEVLWSYNTGGPILSAPSYSHDGKFLYVVRYDGTLLALTAPTNRSKVGVVSWAYQIDRNTRPQYAKLTVGSDDNIYISSSGDSIKVVGADGKLAWSYNVDGPVDTFISIDQLNGTLYFVDGAKYLNAVSAPASSNSSATLKWRYKLDGNVIWPSIAIGAEGSVVYLTSKSGALYAINTASGNLRWRYQAGSAIESSPVIDDAGVVYFGSYDGKVYGVSAEGNLAFRFATGGRVQSTPAIGSDRVLYVGSDDNKLYAVPLPTYSASNVVHQPAALWSHRTPGDIASSPLVGEQVVIIDSYSNALTALHSSSHGLLASSPWPRFRANNQGESSYDPTIAGEIRWSAQTLGVIPSSPALSPDSSQVAVGSYDNNLYVYDVPSGEQLWSYDTGSVIMSSPSYSHDGQVVYVANYTGTLFALTAPSAGSNGVLLWQYQMGGDTGYANPAVDSNDNVYIGSKDKYLHVVDASGKLVWRYRVSSSITSSIAVDERDGTVYFASGLYLYAVSAPDSSSSSGRLKWRYQTDGFPSNSPAIGDGGSVVYIGSRKGYLYAINSIDGSLRWQHRASSSGIDSSPVIDDAGVVYYGSDDGNVYGLDSQGQLVFKFATGDRVESTPAIGSDRVLYFGSKDKQLYAVPLPTYGSNAALHQPEALWIYDTGGVVKSSPVVGEQVVIVGSYRKNLTAIQSESDGLLAASPWPKFKGDNQGWSIYNASSEPNKPPIARISVSPDPDENNLTSSTQVSLDASSSSDPDGDALTYAWSQASGQGITLSSSTGVSTSFTAATGGTYTFTLTVSDGELTDSAVVTLEILQDNRAPTARISVSPDPETTTLTTETQVILSGSASSDPDGDDLTYTWRQPGSQNISLVYINSASTAFTAANPGTYTFTLTVSDGEFTDSAIVELDIAPANRAPVFTSPDTASTKENTSGMIYTATAEDPDADDTLSFSIVGGADRNFFSLSGADLSFTSAPDYENPSDSDRDNVYQLRLRVTDASGLYDELDLNLSVLDVNEAPTALISVILNQSGSTITTATQVTLDGSASSDPDGDILSYSWSEPDGQDISLSTTTDVNTSFTATTPGTYTFTLTVSDGEFAASDVLILEIISANQPPIARIVVHPDPDSSTIATETLVTLDGSLSSDPDGDELSFTWSQASEQNISLSSTSDTNTTFTAATPGIYTFTLTVSDGELQDSEVVTVLVHPVIIPDDFAASAGDANVTLTWTPYSDETTYSIYRSTDPNCDLDNYAIACAESALFTDVSSPVIDVDLTNGTTYYYWIEATLDGITQRSILPISATPQEPTTIVATRPLNDTGITWGGDYDRGNNADCSSNISAPQDCNYGRDADSSTNDDSDGHAGFSFTKLDSSGNPLAASATEWYCVQDNVTGLIWEVKTDDGGIHDKDNSYGWGGVSAIGKDSPNREGTYYDDWDVLVNGANSTKLCGFDDWRVPDIEELRSIVDYSRTNPSIDADYFPNTASSRYWSASPYANLSYDAWQLYFSYGNDDNNVRDYDYHVRLVRVGQ